MSGENEDKPVVIFDFEGQMEVTDVRGYDYKNIFSPVEPIDDMPKRMEDRIKKVRKIRKNKIFKEPFKA